MLRVFIGFDDRFPEPAHVLAYSIRKYASAPVHVQFLDYVHLDRVYGWRRETADPKATTQFTYSRFLVPYLCGYQGTALFLDNDMLCLADVAELAALPMDELALRVTKHDYRPPEGTKMYGAPQSAYPRKNWSSMMLMNCARLRDWTKHAVAVQSGAFLHRFEGIPDGQIGELPPGWNELTHATEGCKLLHYTEGGPWYEQYRDCPHADLWQDYRHAMRRDRGLNLAV